MTWMPAARRGLEIVALIVLGCLLSAGCAGQTSLWPNSDPRLAQKSPGTGGRRRQTPAL